MSGGEELDPARRGVQRVSLGIAAEVGQSDHGLGDRLRVGAEVLLQHRVEGGDPGQPRLAVAIDDPRGPGAFVAALGVGLGDAQARGEVGRDAVVGARLSQRLDQLGQQDHLLAVLPAVGEAPGLELRAGRQHQVGEAGGRGEEVVLHRDELHQRWVAQDPRRPVEVAVLVGEHVGGHRPDELDVRLQRVPAARFEAEHAMVATHLVAAQHRFGPEEAGDAQAVGVLTFGKHVPERARGGLAGESAGPSALNAHVAGDGGEGHAGAHHLLAVGAALHGVALVEDGGPGGGVLAGEAGDRVPGDGGDRLGPGGGLGDAVAGAEDVVAVRLLPGSLGGHLGCIEAAAAARDEVGVVEALGDDDVGHGGHQRGVGARAERDPLVGQAGGARGVARIEADHAGAAPSRLEDEVVAVGAVAGLGGVPAPHEDEPRVDPVLPLVAAPGGAGGGGRRDVGGPPAVAVVVAEVAAEAVQEAAGGLRAGELGVAAGAVGDEEGAVAVAVADPGELRGHLVERLVPGDGCELTGAAGTGAA